MTHKGFTHESQRSQSHEWYTPPHVFKALGLAFDLDVCSPGADAVPWVPAARHLTLADDGLGSTWTGRVWMNPPYGRDVKRWVARFAAYSDGVALVFARPDTRWFHRYALRCAGLLFVRGRLAFVRPDGGSGAATCGSLLLAQGPECCAALAASGLGWYTEP